MRLPRPTLRGLFVDLRPMEVSDAEQVRTWRNSPAVAQFHAARETITAEQQQRWAARVTTDNETYVTIMESCRDRQPIGVTHLKDIDHVHKRAECGLYIGDVSQRDNVYAAEAFYLMLEYAFGPLGLHKVYGHYLASNTRAVRLNAMFGFEVEANYKDEFCFDGQWVDYCRVAVFPQTLAASQAARFIQRRRAHAEEKGSNG